MTSPLVPSAAADSISDERRKLEIVLELTDNLSQSIKINDVLHNAMNALEEYLGAHNSSIYEVDYAAGELFFRLARGDKSESLLSRRIKIGEGVAGHVARTGLPRITGSPDQDDHHFNGFDRESGFQTESMLSVPLVSKGVVVGVIQILNKKDGLLFTDGDLELARIMAGPIAVALENAKLYDRLENKQRETEAELQKTQSRLIKSERRAALSGLARGVAHQIRNPSMSIGGFARRIVQKSPPQAENIIKYAEVIIQENSKLEKLVRQVVELVEVEASLKLSDLNTPAELAVSQARRDFPDLVATLETLPNPPRQHLDSELISEALLEIIKNAVEAGATRVTVRTVITGEDARIESSDDGPGMSAEELAAAQDPFFSTRAHNLGLGLSLAARIAQEHGGRLEIQSPAGQGVLVSIVLPIQPRIRADRDSC